jgi:hypothetical protein
MGLEYHKESKKIAIMIAFPRRICEVAQCSALKHWSTVQKTNYTVQIVSEASRYTAIGDLRPQLNLLYMNEPVAVQTKYPSYGYIYPQEIGLLRYPWHYFKGYYTQATSLRRPFPDPDQQAPLRDRR